jgi:hypothetical protein
MHFVAGMCVLSVGENLKGIYLSKGLSIDGQWHEYVLEKTG